MTRIDRFNSVQPDNRPPLFHHPVIGYALIAFVLAMGHAYAQTLSSEEAVQPKTTAALTTSAHLPVGNPINNRQVELDGVVAPVSLGSAPNGLQQPLLIKDTECGLYAVSREVRDDATADAHQMSI